jgi:hypothetical protein
MLSNDILMGPSLDMVGVTGSIPVAPTIHSGLLPIVGDLRN